MGAEKCPRGPLLVSLKKDRLPLSSRSLSLSSIKLCMSTLLGRLGLTGTEEVGSTWPELLGLGDHRAGQKNKARKREV